MYNKKEYDKEYREENKEKMKLYQKEYRQKNKEKIQIRKKVYCETNKQKLSETNKKYHQKNREEILKKQKIYRENNKQKLSEKQKAYFKSNNDAREKKLNRDREYAKQNRHKINYKRKERKQIDNLFKLQCTIRSLISTSFKKNKFIKPTKTVLIIGCSFEELKQHLESQFESWMNWENHGLYNGEFNYGWDIDHIISSSSAKNEDDIIRLNHYTNLKPLCSKINRDIKRDN
jgi:hypothetical protein